MHAAMHRRHFLLSATAAATLTGCGDQAPRPFTIGMDMTYPPFEFKNERGEPDGVDVKIAQALAKKLGHHDFKLEAYPFDGLIQALQSGKIDLVISAMTATSERRKSIDFSDPYAFTAIAMLVQKTSAVNTPADIKLPGLRYVAKIGTTGESYVRTEIPGAQITTFDDEVACVQEIVQRRAEVFVYDQLSIYSYWQKNKDTTRAVLHPIREESWAIGIRKGNDTLRTQVNEFLAEFRASGALQRLGEEYLAEEKKVLEGMGIPFILR
jgi:polar amino acid transport system substrate-binding protein